MKQKQEVVVFKSKLIVVEDIVKALLDNDHYSLKDENLDIPYVFENLDYFNGKKHFHCFEKDLDLLFGEDTKALFSIEENPRIKFNKKQITDKHITITSEDTVYYDFVNIKFKAIHDILDDLEEIKILCKDHDIELITEEITDYEWDTYKRDCGAYSKLYKKAKSIAKKWLKIQTTGNFVTVNTELADQLDSLERIMNNIIDGTTFSNIYNLSQKLNDYIKTIPTMTEKTLTI